MPASICTFSGTLVNPLEPEVVSIHDIAHALSMICRYGGHSPVHYSVAQHSLIVMHRAMRVAALRAPNATAEFLAYEWLLPALLHDAHEAYIGDIVTPAKQNEPALGRVEDRCAEVVRAALNVKAPAAWIGEIDKEVGARERELFWHRGKVDWVLPVGHAWVPFVTAYNSLRLGNLPPAPAYMTEF